MSNSSSYKSSPSPFREITGRRPPMITKGLCKEFYRDPHEDVVSMCYTELEKDGRCPKSGHHIPKSE